MRTPRRSGRLRLAALLAAIVGGCGLALFLSGWHYFVCYFAGVLWLCKTVTIAPVVAAGLRPRPVRLLAYVFLWPGMDAAAFLDPSREAVRPGVGEWGAAVTKTAFGAALIWGVFPSLPPAWSDWGRAWIGLLGLGFLLFFGVFHLLSLLWRTVGWEAAPMFRLPLFSRNLGEFWSARWNRGFRDLFYGAVFRPWRRTLGADRAEALVFLISGLAHEGLISVAARGGYGLCMLFFGIQIAGRQVARRYPAFRSWWWAFCCTALAAPLLFHLPFLDRVVLPWLEALQ